MELRPKMTAAAALHYRLRPLLHPFLFHAAYHPIDIIPTLYLTNQTCLPPRSSPCLSASVCRGLVRLAAYGKQRLVISEPPSVAIRARYARYTEKFQLHALTTVPCSAMDANRFVVVAKAMGTSVFGPSRQSALALASAVQ